MKESEFLDIILSKEKYQENIFNDLGIASSLSFDYFTLWNVELLNEFKKREQNRLVLITPKLPNFVSKFVITYLLQDILRGDIVSDYRISKLEIGKLYRVGTAVVRYLGFSTDSWTKSLLLELASTNKMHLPLSLVPIMQKTDTERSLSSPKNFNREREKQKSLVTSNDIIQKLTVYKSAHNHTTIIVSPIREFVTYVSGIALNEIYIFDIFLMQSANIGGTTSNIGAGQLTGTPLIVVCSDLNSALSYLKKNKADEIFIDLDSISTIQDYSQQINDLTNLKIPIFWEGSYQSLDKLPFIKKYGFSSWVWTRKFLLQINKNFEDRIIARSSNSIVNYKIISPDDISRIFENIKKIDKPEYSIGSSETLLLTMTDICFAYIKSFLPSLLPQKDALDSLKRQLKEIRYLSNFFPLDVWTILITTAEDLISLVEIGFTLKQEAFVSLVRENANKKINILIPERSNKEQLETDIRLLLGDDEISDRLGFKFGNEIDASLGSCELLIIPFWQKRNDVIKIHYSSYADEIVYLLYQIESRWANSTIGFFESKIRHNENKQTFSTISDNFEDLFDEGFEDQKPENAFNEEQDTFDLMVKKNQERKYRHYFPLNPNKNILMPAIPISFIDGSTGFFSPTKALLDVSNLINNSGDRGRLINCEDILIGSFIVFRQTDSDIIKMYSDVILYNEGKEKDRDKATRWRRSLIEYSKKNHLSFVEIYRLLELGGIQINQLTLKNWLFLDDMIAPKNHEFIKVIGLITKDTDLINNYTHYEEAISNVFSAHIRAGNQLSNLLKDAIASHIKNVGNIQSINWKAMNLALNDIGQIKILKITDIGEKIMVPHEHLNRLVND